MTHPLHRLRDSLDGLTQAALAAEMNIPGLDSDKISKIELGRRQLSAAEAMRLIELYGAAAHEAAGLTPAAGLAESEVAYLGSGEQQEQHAPTLATLLYPQGQADTMIVNARSLVLEGYVPGDRILVDIKRKPRHGNAVIIQVHDDQTGSAETLLRVYKPPHLLPASLDHDFLPFMVDDGRINIMAVVVARYRPAAAEPKTRTRKRPARAA